MGFKCGIVGLPNVGKSTLFNALTQTAAAQAANYPFCTIEPNVGEVSVPDERLEKIAAAAKSQKIIPTRLTFVDIAGLVRGASKGEGLGNQFLANIRECDAIAYVLRCFEDGDVTHVEGRVDPIADAETVETELMLADLESLERRRTAAEKKAKGQDKEAKALLDAHRHARSDTCAEGKPARLALAQVPESEHQAFQQLRLLTSKPALYVCNVDEAPAATGNAYSKSVFEHVGGEGVEDVVISAKIEAELAKLSARRERSSIWPSLGWRGRARRLIRGGYRLLDLITYFTAGPKEVRAWTITKRHRGAGRRRRDPHRFREGLHPRRDHRLPRLMSTLGGEDGAREAGKMRLEGKEYAVAGRRYHALPLRELTPSPLAPLPRGERGSARSEAQSAIRFLLPLWEKDRMRGKPHAVRVR